MSHPCPYCAASIDARAANCPYCGSAVDPTLGPGERVGERFQVVELLGVGPLGATYRVRDLVNGADLALKAVSDALCPTDADRAGFVGRAEIFAGRTIAGCAMPIEVACDARVAYVTAPLVEGVTLRAVLGARAAARKPLAHEEALRVLLSLAASVSALHSATAHGALRPENVMVTARGLILTDAAIAGAIPPDKLQPRMQSFARAAPFISPEAARGKKITATSDLYALGAISAELLAGSPQLSVLEHAKLPGEVEAALRALLDANPSRRPGAVPSLLAALSRACGFDRRPPDPPLPVPEVPAPRPTVAARGSQSGGPPSPPRGRIPSSSSSAPPPGPYTPQAGSAPRVSNTPLPSEGRAETAVTIAGRPGSVAVSVPPAHAHASGPPAASPRPRGGDLPRAPSTTSGHRASEPPTEPRPFTPPRVSAPAAPVASATPSIPRSPALPSIPSLPGARSTSGPPPPAARPASPPAATSRASVPSMPNASSRVPLPGSSLPAMPPPRAPMGAPSSGRPSVPGPSVPSPAPMNSGPRVKIPSLPGMPPGRAPQAPQPARGVPPGAALPGMRPPAVRAAGAPDGDGIDPRLLRAARKIETERRAGADVEDLDSGEIELLDDRD